MTHVAVSRRGPFELSVKACERILDLGGWKDEVYRSGDGYWSNNKKVQAALEYWNLPFVNEECRDRPVLIRVIEELGDQAAEVEGSIRLVTVAGGVKWHIENEYVVVDESEDMNVTNIKFISE